MGKVLKLRRRGPLPEVEERLARLQEELTLTASFAEAMVAGGHYRAAAGVLDEQQRRLGAAESRIARAFALPQIRRRRWHAAIAGVAAVLVLGSGSFATLSLRHGKPSAHAAIRQASDRLHAAATSQGAQSAIAETLPTLESIVDDSTVAGTDIVQIQGLLGEQLSILRNAGSHASPALIKKVQALKKKVDDQVKQTSDTATNNAPNPSAPAPAAPSASASAP